MSDAVNVKSSVSTMSTTGSGKTANGRVGQNSQWENKKGVSNHR